MPETYPLFLLSSLILLLTPGPAVLYIITRSIHQGRRAGIASALGLGLGNLFQASAATAGLSVVLVSSSVLFNAVKTLGAAYLIFIGVRTLRGRPQPASRPDGSHLSLKKIFREGLVINMFNPKVAIFFLAFLPQFIPAGSTSAGSEIFLLGASFTLMGVLTDSLYALISSSMGHILRQSPAFERIERQAAGWIYISLGFGALLAWT